MKIIRLTKEEATTLINFLTNWVDKKERETIKASNFDEIKNLLATIKEEVGEIE